MIIVAGDTIVIPPDDDGIPPTPLQGIGSTLLDTNGRLWDLMDDASPVQLMAGTSGMGAADVSHFWRTSAILDGASYRGSRVDKREPNLTLQVKPHDPHDFELYDDLLWAGLDPLDECVWTVVRPDGRRRFMRIRYTSGGDMELDDDPRLFGWQLYPLIFTAADPHWTGATIRTPFDFVDESPLEGPPFLINPTNTIFNARVTNPGTVKSSPRWYLTGPYLTAQVGVGSAVVSLDTAIGVGESRTIDMDPHKLSIVDGNGARKFNEATEFAWADIPPGANVQLSIDVTGAVAGETSIVLDFDEKLRRA